MQFPYGQFILHNQCPAGAASDEMIAEHLFLMLVPFEQPALPTSEMNGSTPREPYGLQKFSCQSERYFAPLILK